jgi:hypothetical protein
MPIKKTQVIRKLSLSEQLTIEKEIAAIDCVNWIKHFKVKIKLLDLVDGESIHLNWPAKNEFQQMPERPELTPKTFEILCNHVSPRLLGRAYIHRLKPGDKINLHNDRVSVQQLNILNRYQIYLNIPRPASLMFENQLVKNLDNFENSLVDFALEKNHSYHNLSDQNWYFIVFDAIANHVAITD